MLQHLLSSPLAVIGDWPLVDTYSMLCWLVIGALECQLVLYILVSEMGQDSVLCRLELDVLTGIATTREDARSVGPM